MVARRHGAGLEVILDVVNNHTAEGNELGPTLSFKDVEQCQRLPPAAQSPVMNSAAFSRSTATPIARITTSAG
jgi:hypothetical protein